MSDILNGEVFTKATISGDKKVLVINPRAELCRKSRLSDDWKRARISLIYSWTNAYELDGEPVPELVSHGGSERGKMHVGFTNGLGMPGDPGVRFVGLTTHPSISGVRLGGGSSGWHICQPSNEFEYLRPGCLDGTALLHGMAANGADTQTFVKSPTATERFAASMLLELDVSTPGVLRVGFAISSNISAARILDLWSVSAMPPTLVAAGDFTSGWWSTFNPIGCTYIFIRYPFNLNRLRLLGVQTQQLA